MSGGKARAHIDLALVDKSQSLLCLFVEDKRPNTTASGKGMTVSMDWPHSQVIAHALGAYSANVIEARQVARLKEDIDPEIDQCFGTDLFDMVGHSLFFERMKLTYTYRCFPPLPSLDLSLLLSYSHYSSACFSRRPWGMPTSSHCGLLLSSPNPHTFFGNGSHRPASYNFQDV